MRVAIYARVSSESQEARGTIGSQLEALRRKMTELGHNIVQEYTDDGYSGARLDRPGLDALRDAAEAGVFEQAWCLTPDRLARSYAYQIVVTDELTRHGVQVCYLDAPPLADDPAATLLVQVQGVIAEYERAKIAERNRRGRLFRARAGEIVYRLVPYGYRRLPRGPAGPSHLEVYEAEAIVVRRIFDDFVAGGCSMRRICRGLYEDGILSPTGNATWSIACLSKMLRNSTYRGRAIYNRHQAVPPARGRKSTRNKLRPPEEWIEIPVPAIVSEEVFDAAQRVSRDHTFFSPRRSRPVTGCFAGWWSAVTAASRRIVRTARGGVDARFATTSAIGGGPSRPAAPTAPARNPRPAPRRWRRWCGTNSARPCFTRRPCDRGRRCSVAAANTRTMSYSPRS
jgi:DNA invertase Pin-like site-specific DNA recombinase